MMTMVAGGTDTAGPGRGRRLAGAASVTFLVATVIGFYAWQ
ncbi:hypothetical protein [Streptomyces sp. NPDC048142]